MKSYFLIMSFVLTSLFLVNTIFAAAGSMTVSYQLLDSSVRPDGETTVFLTLTNPSTTIDVRTIKLWITSGPYVSVSKNYLEMGGLSPTASQQTSLTIYADSNAISTTSYITVRATYFTDSTEHTTTINVPVTIRRVPILQITNVNYDTDLIEPGDKVKLTFDISNDGDGIARDIKISLNQTTGLFVTGSGDYFLTEIQPDSKEPVSFDLTIDPSVEIDTYSIPLAITYSDETRTQSYSVIKYIGLEITGKFDFMVYLSSQDVIAPGKKGNFKIEVANIGSQDALYLITKILPSDPLTNINPSELYIGNLKPDDYDSTEFEVKVTETSSPNIYPLNVQLIYKDSYNNQYTENYQVGVKVSTLDEYSQANAKSIPLTTKIIIAFIIIAVIYFVYKKIKKKK